MSVLQPNDRSAGANEITGAVRREVRATRQNQARYAQLLSASYDWTPDRIAEGLEMTVDTIRHLLAADGVNRCVECSFGFHRSCMGSLNIDIRGQDLTCQCQCQS